MPRSSAVPVAKVPPEDPERRKKLVAEQASYFASLLERLKRVPLLDPVDLRPYGTSGAEPVLVSSPLGYVDEEKLRSMMRAAGVRGGVDAVHEDEARRKRVALERLAHEYRALFEVARLEDKESLGDDAERHLARVETLAVEGITSVHGRVHELFGEVGCPDPERCNSSRMNIRQHGAAMVSLAEAYESLWHDLDGPAWVPPEGETGLPEAVHTLREWGCTFRDIAFIRLWFLGRRPVQAEELRRTEGAVKKAAEVHKRRFEALRKRLLGRRNKPAGEKRPPFASGTKLTPKKTPTKRR